MIDKATEADVLRLFHAEKWRIGTIAAQLGLHHSTVQRVLAQAGLDPAQVSPRPSRVDPYLPLIMLNRPGADPATAPKDRETAKRHQECEVSCAPLVA